MKQLLNRVLIFTAILIVSVYTANPLLAQNDSDSTSINKHSPKKATYLALIPGLGQIYNKKYWKLPIVYTGFAVTGYFGFWNRGEYLLYNDAYICSVNDCADNLSTSFDENQDAYVCSVLYVENELANKYTSDQLKSARDYYRRNMELSFIIMGAWYILQILDASVDAHLYYWEVNDKLSLRVEPEIQRIPNFTPQIVPGDNVNHNGIKVTVSF